MAVQAPQAPPAQPQYQSPAVVSQPQNYAVTADPISDPDNWRVQQDAATRAIAEQAIQRAAQQFLPAQASLARDASRRDPEFGTVWTRYGAEIDAMIATIPLEHRGNKDLWDNAARIVRGNHYAELAREEAERLASRGAPATERSNSFGGAPPTPGYVDEISEMWAKNEPYTVWARQNGVDEQMMRESARKRGYSPKQFAELMRNSQTLRAPAANFSTHGTQHG